MIEKTTQNKSSANTFFGIIGILIGILNLGLIVYALVIPAEQRDDPNLFYLNYNEDPFIMSFAWLILIATSIGGLLIVPKITEMFRTEGKSEILGTMQMIAIIGYATSAVSFLTLLARMPSFSTLYLNSTVSERDLIIGLGLPLLDPYNFVILGFPGSWILSLSFMGLKKGKNPKLLNIFGIIFGIAMWLAVFAQIFHSGLLDVVAACIGALIAPIWFIWIGTIFLRKHKTIYKLRK